VPPERWGLAASAAVVADLGKTPDPAGHTLAAAAVVTMCAFMVVIAEFDA
jgi:hypothetical protein